MSRGKIGNQILAQMENYPKDVTSPMQYKPPSRREILLQKIAYLERELEGSKAALEALDNYPDIEKVFDLLEKFCG